MYYSLTNYYQNHRRYVKSRSDYQLRGEDVGYSSLEGSDCAPFIGNDSTRQAYAPCGAIANSMFNGNKSFHTYTSLLFCASIPCSVIMFTYLFCPSGIQTGA